MANAFQEKALKDTYLEARQESQNPADRYRGNDATYSFRMIAALRDMAENDVWPDGHFSDEECNIWSMFHLLAERSKRQGVSA